ncbi:SH3 domain-containing protein [Alphaproteobacteria bacterium GH1-50]|uniref:SH3 domain-containing protein n=1 Tax=Kangsaoukella pontilimi TaxID=2691042 RepID=A0A7C9IID9_9RHOB|nr:SH3 domain-containing protein [Kangsaoukella pontilimi]MXQ08302.1 SH3 domain-containing protein [Kangsaoukella pontilimi]
MIRAVLAIVLLLAGPVHATQDAFPGLYDVTGVASDDVLNIRSGPGASHAIIGSLPPDATDIEVIAPDDRHRWAKINFREGTGWVSMDYLVPHPGQVSGFVPDIRHCFGTEPFWSLTYDQPRITLSMPDIEPRDGLISGYHGSLSRRDRFAFTGSFFPTAAGDREIQLFVRQEICTDGMSDREYGIAADVLIKRPTAGGDHSGTGFYAGCCSLTPPSAR